MWYTRKLLEAHFGWTFDASIYVWADTGIVGHSIEYPHTPPIDEGLFARGYPLKLTLFYS